MFVRSILALSLSCAFTTSVLAATQPTNKSQISATVEDPIDPLAVETASEVANTKITAQEQRDLNQAASTLQKLEKSENLNADIAQAPTAAANKAVKASWTLDGLNQAQWYENIGKGQFPVYARAHVMLNNAHASPGAIDGSSGMNTLKAIASFQQMQGLEPSGTLTKETWDRLIALQGNKPAFVEYTITDADIKGPYAASIPRDYALQAKMKGLYYTSPLEMLSEKFHMDEAFMKKLNPNASFLKRRASVLLLPIFVMNYQKIFI